MTGKNLKEYQGRRMAERSNYATSLTEEEGTKWYREYEERYLKARRRELPSDPEHRESLNHVVCKVCGRISHPYPTDLGAYCSCWSMEILDDGWWLIDHKLTCPVCFDAVIKDDAHYTTWRRRGELVKVPERFRTMIESADFDPENPPAEIAEWQSTCFASDSLPPAEEEVSHEVCTQST